MCEQEKEVTQENAEDDFEAVLSRFAFSLSHRCKGKCIQCGKCCVENWRFDYMISSAGTTREEIIVPTYNKEIPKGRGQCESYDPNTKTCVIHGCKRPVCKYWPLLESDIAEVGCPGFYVENDS